VNTDQDDLRRQVAALTERVARLETQLKAPLAARPPSDEHETQAWPPQAVVPHAAFPPTPPSASREQATAHLPQPPSFDQQSAPSDERSLESRIGSQWFNRIGILAVLIGAAWFLKLAFDNHWIGPLGRIVIGLIAGAGLVAWSERFRSRGYTAFSYSLKALGSGVLYLSLWAAFSLFHLFPAPVAFAAMILVTAFNGFMAWVQDSELLALYAIVGGFSTPLLLSTGENHQVALFSYLLILNLAVLALLVLRPWSRLLLGAFAGSVFFFLEWSVRFYAEPEFATTVFFLSLFFLIFAIAPRLVRISEVPLSEARISDGTGDIAAASKAEAAVVALLLVVAPCGFLGFYLLLDSTGAQWAFPWLAVAFAAFYLLLLRLPARTALHPGLATLSALHLAIAVIFLTIAVPLKTHGRWLTIGWLVEGAVQLWLAPRTRSRLLRALALSALALGVASLLVIHPPASTRVIWNERFATYVVGILIFAFTGSLAGSLATREQQPGHEPSDPDADFPLSWTLTAALSLLLVNLLILLAIGCEVHSYWWYLRYNGNWSLQHDYRMYAQFTYSALFMLYGAILLALGFVRRSAFLRWQALVLLAVSIGKVFLVDIGRLSQGYRIVSFLGLGALLLAVSFAYQRDWLDLREHGRHTS
jgi:uncharacterized membrane protein